MSRHARPGKWWRRWFRSAPPQTSAYDNLVPIKLPDLEPEPFTFCRRHPFTPPGATRCGHCPDDLWVRGLDQTWRQL